MEFTFIIRNLTGIPAGKEVVVPAGNHVSFRDVLEALLEQLDAMAHGDFTCIIEQLDVRTTANLRLPVEHYDDDPGRVATEFGTRLAIQLASDRPSMVAGSLDHAPAPAPPGSGGGALLPAPVPRAGSAPPGTTVPAVIPARHDTRGDASLPAPKPKRVVETTGIEGESSEPGPAPVATRHDKNVAVEYFDVMNPDNYYPLVVDISDFDITRKRAEENMLTGERKIQARDEFSFEVENPVISVRPVFPGCSVTPAEILTNLEHENDTLTFYVTPLVHGDIHGQLDFCSGGKVIQRMALSATVKDPRHARAIALYGMVASLVPRAADFLGIDLGSSMSLEDALPLLGSLLSGLNLSVASFIAIAGIIVVAIIALVYYTKQKPEKTTTKYRFKDFRLSMLDRT